MKRQSTRHVVVLPYYCQEEIDRYQQTSDWLVKNCDDPLDCTFLLAASPKATPSKQLHEAFERLGPVVSFQCPTQVFGYPAGPTAMFWDAMDYIAEHFSGDGFALWFESDMAFVKPNWLDRLAAEWDSGVERPVMMGCYVPHVYKYRFFRRPKLLLNPHINGGACYALDFARRMPQSAREGVFDMAVYEHGLQLGEMRPTRQIGFSTVARARRDVLSAEKCVLHGFMQDKNRFITECVRPVSAAEKRMQAISPLQEQWELLQRRIRVMFVRRGHRAMLENMFLAKQQADARASSPSPRGIRKAA
ncbi:MAG: hypothetical protein ACKO0N_11485 [Planctomycetota bacterium]